ncbi:MAG: asparaginase [Salibacteraceae bacterium]
MNSILIIYTGGTIGMIESEDRQNLVPFNLEQVLEKVPELKKIDARLDSISFENPIDSSDMQPEHWNSIALLIEERYEMYDGFVVLHGSDTLAYTASALSFMFDGLSKPVILTGSQLPIGMIRTDARENLITAVEFAARTLHEEPVIQEVAVYFEDLLYRGNRTKKYSTEAFDAFISPNYPVLGEAGVNLNFDYEELYRSDADEFKVVYGFDNRVAVLTLFPGISEHLIRSVLSNPELRGIVMMTFGSGNAPTQQWFLNAVSEAVDRGLVIVNVTQCAKGKVEQGKYETSVGLLNCGVVSCGDMTVEATLTKMMFLLGQSGDSDWVRDKMATNLRGELSVS